MSNPISNFLRNILAKPIGTPAPYTLHQTVVDSSSPAIDTLHQTGEDGGVNVKMRIAVYQGINGTILELIRFKPNRNGSDWYATHYIVQDGQRLSDAIAMCLMMKD
jgi:hypothetical protein